MASNTSFEIPTKKARCLLAYLSYHPGEQQPREKLLGLFWGESEEKRARHSLRQTLTYLRKSLEPLDPSPLSSDRTMVRLEPDFLEVDIHQFLQLAASGASQDLERAIGFYRGDLLDGVYLKEAGFQSWLESERRHLREVNCRVMESLVELRRQTGDFDEALRLAQRLIALDPLQERVHRLLMVLYSDMGMREAALLQFERCRTLLADDLAVEPEPETLALFESLRSSGRAKKVELDQVCIAPPTPSESDPSSRLSAPGLGHGRWRREIQGAVSCVVAPVPKVKPNEADEVYNARKETNSPEAYDAVLRAHDYQRNYTKEDFAIAIACLRKAISLDPEFARAHTTLGSILWHIADDDWSRSFGLSHQEVIEKTRHHLRLGMKVSSYQAHLYQSRMRSNEGRHEEAIAEAKVVVAVNPDSVTGNEALGRVLNLAGRAEEAIEPLRRAIRRNPRGDENGWLYFVLGEALYLSARYREAAEAYAIALDKNRHEWTYLFLAASLGQLGKWIKAEAALTKFEEIRAEADEDPYTVAHLEGWGFKEPKDRERLQEGLLRAGMQEGVRTEAKVAMAEVVAPTNVEGAITIDIVGAKNLFEQGVKVIDVRDRADWNDGHIPGTTHLYIFEDFTKEKLSSVVAKGEEVIIFGEGSVEGSWAAIAVTRAVTWGFERVYYLPAGFPGWKAAGYPIKARPKEEFIRGHLSV